MNLSPFRKFNILVLFDENGNRLDIPRLIKDVYVFSEHESIRARDARLYDARYTTPESEDLNPEEVDDIVASMDRAIDIKFSLTGITVTGLKASNGTYVFQSWIVTTLNEDELSEIGGKVTT